MEEILIHHGILGQKWGIRRYQNEDGSLTALGKKHVTQQTMAEKRTEAAKKQDAANKRQSEINALKERDTYNKEILDGRKKTAAAQKQDEAIRVAARGRSDEEEDELEKARAKQKLKALEQGLVDAFGESEALKYVKINHFDDPRKTSIIYTNPIDGSVSTFSLTMAENLVSKLQKDLNTASDAKKRTDAAKRQEEARKKQDTANKKEALKESVKNINNPLPSVANQEKKLKNNIKKLESKLKDISGSSSISEGRKILSATKSKASLLNANLYNSVLKEYNDEKEKLKKLEMNEAYRKSKLKQSEISLSIDDVLIHHGILGQKWGIRRYQNEDGSLTEAGKKKYAKSANKLRKLDNKLLKANEKRDKAYDKWQKEERKASKHSRVYMSNFEDERRVKADKAASKYSQANTKAQKTYKKAIKWYKKMEKKFSNANLSDMNSDDLELGKRYAQMIWENSRKR